MKNQMKYILLILVLGFISTNVTLAQPYNRMYDKNTVEIINGSVKAIETIKNNAKSNFGGIHLIITYDQGEINVHVGPEWFLDDNNFVINENDKIEVTGSKVTSNGETYIIAANLKIGEKSIVLRDESGIPLWSGQNNK